jgi:hypothetical protein
MGIRLDHSDLTLEYLGDQGGSLPFEEMAPEAEATVERWIGEKIQTELGQGMFGTAYLTESGNRVLKITSDQGEIVASEFLKNKRGLPSVPKIWKVVILEGDDGFGKDGPLVGLILKDYVPNFTVSPDELGRPPHGVAPRYDGEKVVSEVLMKAWDRVQSISEKETGPRESCDEIADVLEGFMVQFGVSPRTKNGRMLKGYAKTMRRMGELGICGYDFHLANLGYNEDFTRIEIIDLGGMSATQYERISEPIDILYVGD